MTSALKYTIHFTAMCGAEAQITGETDAIIAIEDAFQMAGIRYNQQVGCWDAGFYSQSTSPLKRPFPRRSDSVECPHCHWGFSPHAIEQHIREKH